MTNFFLKNLYTKYGWEASPRLFYKKSKLTKSLDQQSELYMSDLRSTEKYQN